MYIVPHAFSSSPPDRRVPVQQSLLSPPPHPTHYRTISFPFSPHPSPDLDTPSLSLPLTLSSLSHPPPSSRAQVLSVDGIDSGGGLPLWALVVIIVGAVLAFAAVVGITWCMMK